MKKRLVPVTIVRSTDARFATYEDGTSSVENPAPYFALEPDVAKKILAALRDEAAVVTIPLPYGERWFPVRHIVEVQVGNQYTPKPSEIRLYQPTVGNLRELYMERADEDEAIVYTISPESNDDRNYSPFVDTAWSWIEYGEGPGSETEARDARDLTLIATYREPGQPSLKVEMGEDGRPLARAHAQEFIGLKYVDEAIQEAAAAKAAEDHFKNPL